MFNYIVGVWNTHTVSYIWLIHLNSTGSSVSSNIAVSNTSCICTQISLLSHYITSQKLANPGNIIQHLLIIMQSSHRTIHNQFKNEQNSGVIADLGVISMINALSGGRHCSYTVYKMLSCWYYCWKSWCSIISRITTTIILLGLIYASNINSMLFPLLVGMTVIIGLLLCWIICSASPYMLCSLSSVYWVICYTTYIRFTYYSQQHCQICCSATISSYSAYLHLLSTDSGLPQANINPKKWCQSMLDMQNMACWCTIMPAYSISPWL